jgi:hypothetical protein
VLIIAALAHGVITLIVGAIVLLSVCRGRRRERLTYPVVTAHVVVGVGSWQARCAA